MKYPSSLRSRWALTHPVKVKLAKSEVQHHCMDLQCLCSVFGIDQLVLALIISCESRSWGLEIDLRCSNKLVSIVLESWSLRIVVLHNVDPSKGKLVLNYSCSCILLLLYFSSTDEWTSEGESKKLRRTTSTSVNSHNWREEFQL